MSTEKTSSNLEIGSKVLYKQQVYPTKADESIGVGMFGVVCDIDDNTWFNESEINGLGKLTVYVVFRVPNKLTRDIIAVYDWFTIDELELVENVR